MGVTSESVMRGCEMGTGCGGCDGRGCGSEVVGKSLRVGSGM